MRYDCIIIGGGIIGTAVLDRLTAYRLNVLLLEAQDDVASFATRANSGIVHAGYDCEPGTLKAKYNVRGNSVLWKDAEELDVPNLKCGSLVVAREDGLKGLEELQRKGNISGVKTEILDAAATRRIEPNVASDIAYSLYAPSAGIVSPYQLAIGYADRAILNGGEVRLNSSVTAIEEIDNGYRVTAGGEMFEARAVVNCAGNNGAPVNDLVGAEHYDSVYRRGDYFVLDNTERKNVHTVIFPLPTAAGKGILVAPTADGNVIYGPTAVDTVNGDTASTADSLDALRQNVPLSFDKPAFNKCIRVYSGLRTLIGHDFVIGESKLCKNFFMAIGICSPGLTSAPAIADDLSQEIAKKLGAERKKDIVTVLPRRKTLERLLEDGKQLNELVKEDPAWGRIVCRCEKVTEAEIIAAIHSPLPATTVDAVKRRTRAGMGRCQGGFCGPRVMEIISRELGIPLEQVKKGLGAEIARYRVKEVE